jgi:hypothetical protein
MGIFGSCIPFLKEKYNRMKIPASNGAGYFWNLRTFPFFPAKRRRGHKSG